MKKSVLPVAAVGATGFAAFLLYAQARGMMWGFDDYINLKGLAGVSSRDGLIDFLFGGIAGPGGRILSLLTFLANYQDWPGNPWGFAQTTYVFHGLNSMLMFLLVQRLAQQDQAMKDSAPWMAALTAALWLILPIHASGILLPVQRMTHVSAFFTLVTLYGYALMRCHQARQVPSIAGILQLSAWVAFGAFLAFMAKENGLMTVTLVALVEAFFFLDKDAFARSMRLQKAIWQAWLASAAAIIALLLGIYLWMNWGAIQANYQYNRNFSLSERLATELVIMWEYMRQILVPRAALLGPYHDGHAIYSWRMPQPYVALVAWAAAVALSLWCMQARQPCERRKAAKYALFSLLWFLACHQIESTVIPLELYFEHRNYLAAIGFCILLAHLITSAWKQASSKLIVVSGAGAYLLYMIFSLHQITSLWGNPPLANEMWHINHPQSTRAAQAVVNDLLRYRFNDAALKVADEFIEKNESIDLAIQTLPHLCKATGPDLQKAALVRAHRLLADVRKPAGITTGLASLGTAVRDRQCPGISLEEYREFLRALLLNEKVRNFHPVRHHVHYEMALTEKSLDHAEGYVEYAKLAFFDYPSLSIGEAIAVNLFQSHRPREAAEWIEEMLKSTPDRLQREAWKIRLGSLQAALKAVAEEVEDE
ncbi:MAG: hypothetical protein EON54_05160 [Alcaligenaceae bacterium]|nr:MAG: hypothetical protein EON54_05160 [Alcaligenaceae bacterium]